MTKGKRKNKNQRIIRYVAIGSLLLTTLILLVYNFMPNQVPKVEATAVTNGVAMPTDDIPGEDTNAAKGTESNPFVILEIVPYEGYAEIGYLISGCEPVDMSALCNSDNIINIINNPQLSSAVKYCVFADETIPTGWQYVPNQSITLYGYYERVADNTGNFKQQQTSGYTFSEVPKNTGNFIWKTVVDSTRVDQNALVTQIGGKLYTTRTDKDYYFQYAYTNYNYFLKNVLHVADAQISNYHVVIKTITPSELTSSLPSTGGKWIDRADLISISSSAHNTNLTSVWKTYKKNKTASVNNTPPTDFGTNDLSWAAVMKIFNKVTIASDYAGLLIDSAVYTNPPTSSDIQKSVTPYQVDYNGTITTYGNDSENGNSNNVYKLAVMLRSMDPIIFYNWFLNTTNEASRIGSDGSFTLQTSTDAKNYWSNTTFMPAKKDGTKAGTSDWSALWDSYRLNYDRSGALSVAGRVFMYDSGSNILKYLATATITNSASNLKYAAELFGANTSTAKTPAQALSYILGTQSTKNENVKTSLTILDIEPCHVFTMTYQTVLRMAPYYSGKINVKSMTSAEFNGKIEDLSSTYDMIYLGMNSKGMYGFRSASLTVGGQSLMLPDYNDNNLDGKIYLHVGDALKGYVGASDNSYLNINWIPGKTVDFVRMSGNDFTKLKTSDLTEYLNAGYPILADEKLYHVKAGTDFAMQISNKVVDKASAIYKFVSNVSGSSNFISTDNGNLNSIITEKLKVQKPKLSFTKQPTEYNTNETGKTLQIANGKVTVPDGNYINGVDATNKSLEYIFQIKGGDISAKYQISLYIDANGDGRFKESERQTLSELYADNNGDGTFKRNEKLLNPTTQTLEGAKNYKMLKKLPSDYYGVVSWKLVITNTNNSSIHDEAIGYSAVKSISSQTKEQIRILQILPNNTPSLNLAKNLEQKGYFYKYTKDLNDYTVIVNTITSGDFEKGVGPVLNADGTQKKNSNGTLVFESKTDSQWLNKEYNMLIIGFVDSYNNISNSNGALDKVKAFIQAGKSVLFTHDTASMYNTTDSKPGYSVNNMFRGILGIDRFGVRYTSGSARSIYNYGYLDKNGVMQSTIDQASYYNPNSVASIYTEIQGYSTLTIAKKTYTDGKVTQYLPYTYDGINAIQTANDNRETTIANNLNNGPITRYPYYIDGSIQVANTHCQWNQLNLEDPGVTVWYTLGGSSSISDSSQRFYNAFYNDASNNYYIYNKGNVTYSGIGHSSASTNELTEKETMLFVNTMIAAYRCSIYEPEVDITNQTAFNSGTGKYAFYLNTDASEAGKSLEDVMVQFVPSDYNFFSQYLYVRAMLGTKSLDILDEKGQKVTVPTKTIDGKDYYQLNNENTYYVKYDKEYFNTVDKDNPDTKKITFTVVNTENKVGTSEVQFLQRTLFDLD